VNAVFTVKPDSEKPDPLCAGYTLIELMVAAVCLGISISGIMAMIGVGREMEMETSFRRQARIIAGSELERDIFHYRNFPFLTTNPITPVPVLLKMDATNQDTALMNVTVSSSTVNWNNVGDPTGIPSQPISYKSIQVCISWTVAAHADSIILQKRIAQTQ
jgi:type II secretory pathway pseudopilin PulG